MSDLAWVVGDSHGVYSGARGFDYFKGISAQGPPVRAGMCMHRLEIPPGDRARRIQRSTT